MTDRISSKADVLKSLYGKLKYSRVEKLKIVTGAELDADSYGLAAEIAEEFAGGYIVVRSSSSMKTDSTLRMPVTMRVFWEWTLQTERR